MQVTLGMTVTQLTIFGKLDVTLHDSCTHIRYGNVMTPWYVSETAVKPLNVESGSRKKPH